VVLAHEGPLVLKPWPISTSTLDVDTCDPGELMQAWPPSQPSISGGVTESICTTHTLTCGAMGASRSAAVLQRHIAPTAIWSYGPTVRNT